MKQVIRVSKKEFEDTVEDRVTEGFKLVSKTDRQAVLIKRRFGGLVGHFIVFVLTVWWTFFIGNLVWLAFNYFAKADEVQVKLRK